MHWNRGLCPTNITSGSTSAWCFCRSANMPKRNCGTQKPTRSCHFGRKAAVALSWNYSGISQCTCVASNGSCKYQTIIRPANGISFFAQIKIHAKQSITFWKYFDPFKPLRGHGSGNLRLLIIQRCRRRMKTVGELSHRTQTVESTVFQTLQSTSVKKKEPTKRKKKTEKFVCSNFYAHKNLKHRGNCCHWGTSPWQRVIKNKHIHSKALEVVYNHFCSV